MATPDYLTVDELTPKEQKRIFSKISIDPVTGCWNWIGAISEDGYAVTTWHAKYIPAHRLLYAWKKGPIPAGQKKKGSLELDHAVCNNRRCVNPDHLELVPTRINVLRGSGITANNARKTHCVHGHLLPTEPNSPDGRRCVECTRIRARAYAANHKEQRASYAKENRDKINVCRRAWRHARRLLGLPE